VHLVFNMGLFDRFKSSKVEASKPHLTKEDETVAADWYNKGVNLYGEGLWDEAISSFDKALEINPQLAEAWYYKGTINDMFSSRRDEAIACFDKALMINPRYADAEKGRQAALAKLPNSMRVSDDPFGRAIKKVLEHLQRTRADSSFGYADLPPLDADYRSEVSRKLARDRSSGALVLSPESEMTYSGILKQLKDASLIETVGYKEFKLTARGRQIKRIDVG
jgi:tetratricopeptide (TPR) repeat protein